MAHQPHRNFTPALLTTHEACTFLAVSRTTLWDWRKRGLVPEPVRIGSVLRWRLSDLEGVIARAAGEPAASAA